MVAFNRIGILSLLSFILPGFIQLSCVPLASAVRAPPAHPLSHCISSIKKRRKSKLIEFAEDEKTVFLDVRTENEILAPPFLTRKFLHIPVTLGDTSEITTRSRELPKDLHTPIIVFSGWLGGRAFGAKTTLEKLGYDKVVNGRGVRNVIEACSGSQKSLQSKLSENTKSMMQRFNDSFRSIGESFQKC